MTLAVEMRGIEKAFGTNKVLKNVDFLVEVGSIHALLGENGTGKTTLMNILAGLLNEDSGRIRLFGQEIGHLTNEIAFIHQELSLVNDLTVYENLYLGRELKKSFFLDKKTMQENALKVIKDLGISLNPTTKVEDLNPAYKQITEILRAILQNAKVIIMDEPTTSLTDIEIEHLFEVMRNLSAQGVCLIFISHKLNEVLEICDSYTVMRDGVVVESDKVTPDLTEEQLSALMIGRELTQAGDYIERSYGDVILELKNLSNNREFRNVNLILKKGEILGVTGLLGDGRSELFQSVVGANSLASGDILIEGQVHKIRKTTDAFKYGISYVPKNRKENGIIKDLNISENLTLAIMQKYSKYQLLEKKKLNNFTENYRNKLNIKLDKATDSILSLSGGNQQKVVLARALSIDPKIVILDNPTQGVDIGAKMEIYALIKQLADEGISFVILSNEFPEIERLCDRVYVMFEGEIVQEFNKQELNEQDVMLAAAGGEL